ncbi:MAG: ABC transporter permease [Caldilineaceae bacterium]|nr:ABC transporter permease [Caldilineaceae bacterium]
MHSILNITRNDLRIFFSQRGNLMGLVALPVLFTLVLGWAFGGNGDNSAPRLRVDLIDQDQSAPSAQFIDDLHRANDALVLCPADNDADDFCQLNGEPLTVERAIARARNEDTEALIVIPAGYAEGMASFAPVQIDFYAAGNPTLPNPVRQSLDVVVQQASSAALTTNVLDAVLQDVTVRIGIDALTQNLRSQFATELYANVQTQFADRPDTVRYVASAGEDAASVDQGFGQSTSGMGAMYVMFTVLGGMAVLQRERAQWTLQRLNSLPVAPWQILAGKMLTYFCLGMLQFLVVFATGLLVGLNYGRNWPALMLVMVAFVLCCTAIAFAIAPRVTNEEQAGGVARLLAMALAPLGGAWWPLEIVPPFMRQIGHLSPVAWAMDAFHDLLFFGGRLTDILPEVGVLLAITILFFGIGVNSFRKLLA